VAFGDLAENAATSLSKGDRVVVTGKLRAESWESADGEQHTAIGLVADEIGAGLRFAIATVQRVNRRTAADATEQAAS